MAASRKGSGGESKPFDIPKGLVWEAWKRVEANRGAAGVDEQSIQNYAQDLSNNLYKLWNRMSSGSYFPPPVKAVPIPKRGTGGGERILGVPTVDDRIAQTVAAIILESKVEPMFHPDSYGYRPGRSALDAVRVCRDRCRRHDWVVDLDLARFFDSIPHDLLLRAVARHVTDKQRWLLLYVRRWLEAPLQSADGSLVNRDRGSPQGSAVSPVLANIFLHYAFDAWMVREHPDIPFERYCDDVIVHCRTQRQADQIRDAIAQRLGEVGLELNESKTHVVYCKDWKRNGPHGQVQFTFLGYTFQPRLAKTKTGRFIVSFGPAISGQAAVRIRQQMRRWRLHQRSGSTLEDLARTTNAVTRGWINYYGRFRPSALFPIFRHLNEYLVRWAMGKYKRLRRRPRRAWRFLAEVARREPDLFVHWQFGMWPSG